MINEKEEPTITMAEEQLERIIRTSIKTALRELKEEEKLPGNEVNEFKEAPASYSLITVFTIVILIIIFGLSSIAVIFFIKLMIDNGFSSKKLTAATLFLLISVATVFSYIELIKTKKVEVLNMIFTAITTVSNLIIAIVGVVFAYMALK